jgi:hypothetical protein
MWEGKRSGIIVFATSTSPISSSQRLLDPSECNRRNVPRENMRRKITQTFFLKFFSRTGNPSVCYEHLSLK